MHPAGGKTPSSSSGGKTPTTSSGRSENYAAIALERIKQDLHRFELGNGLQVKKTNKQIIIKFQIFKLNKEILLYISFIYYK